MNPSTFVLMIAVFLNGCSTPLHKSPTPSDELIEHIIGVALAEPHPFPAGYFTPEDVRAELRDAFAVATLIVEATVTNDGARIPSASGKWMKGWPETYPVLIVSPTRILRGLPNETAIIIAHMGSGTSIDMSAIPRKNFRNGESGVFFLRPNKRVSKWSGQKIWDIVEGVPIKNDA